MDVFELARRYHDELDIKEPSMAAMAAKLFDELGLKMVEFLKEEGYALVGTRFKDYDKGLVLDVTKGENRFEITLRKS
ncbi:hypothetical protein [Thermococcus piezophilus]|uniref:Uncharacterized protein n=1 Tax=Thermococcus piezophilus TaxID=1712654 RepID=A0A172WHX9_9EURY|nr:hypothetical protein [Thermococcus piezophilus]ANF23051.1 hypothetical protein A7C91_07640 [Thermococcus piezophilus]